MHLSLFFLRLLHGWRFNLRKSLILIIVLPLTTTVAQKFKAPSISTIAPTPTDFSSMWWKDGFPSRVEGAPWLRRILTGNYAFELNTESLEVTHLSALGAAGADFGSRDNAVWKKPAPAKLELEIVVDGKPYYCTKGGTWTRASGPRLIESGRFVQRADVTDLHFASKEGQTLAFETRFETIAWPDRLGLILHAQPKKTGSPPPPWQTMTLSISLQQQGGERHQEKKTIHYKSRQDSHKWHQIMLPINPATSQKITPNHRYTIEATSPAGKRYPVAYDAPLLRHRVNLNTLESSSQKRSNDALERIQITLTNPTTAPQTAPISFEKTNGGFQSFLGSSITGMSLILCDKAGNPSGIPVQLSKNWHHDRNNPTFSGTWLHASTLLHLPPRSITRLQLVIVSGHWGGVPAASHAQLCLIGWGSNQLWEQSAIGSWGESICYEPDQAQAGATITDVRPLMVTADWNRLWKWTPNVGGGDFFRLFAKDNQRIPPHTMTATHHRLGPCLTEVSYQGLLTTGITHATTVSIARTDDLVRATYQLRMDVTEATDFSRFVFFQIGSDTYNYTREKKFAIGHGNTLTKEWQTNWGEDSYRTPPLALTGTSESHPWVSLHEGKPIGQEDKGPGGNRGFIIRKWEARLGGEPAQPWVRERGIGRNSRESSIIDLLPPPDLTALLPGDYLEATIEHLVIPQAANDYYGPNKDLKAALLKSGNTWQMVAREALHNARVVKTKKGQLLQKFPDIRIATDKQEEAIFQLSAGLGYVPLTFTHLRRHKGYQLQVNGKPLDQSVNGKDFWQNNYDPVTKTWTRTYNIPSSPKETQQIKFGPLTKK